ncbi:hypothetical protein [Parasphingorhabdus halotolerans]|uniref:hypothetical protein n=1 Tax=Parasphingorhabdus halotolerans TaxID=2725558 RepID=UPI001B3A416A|nr:hypothetical protein [Parasphingorhabdus halotolerans]
MYTRTFSLFAIVAALSACGKPDNDVLAEAEERAAAQKLDDGKIECAINGDTDFNRGCETERLSGENGVTLIIRHPDGGFRRFNILTDGRGLEAADGSEKAAISIVEDGKILVSVGQDKYIMPAQLKPSKPPIEAAAAEAAPDATNPAAGD